ncbi:MAG: hypothetical protein IPK88_16735 [Saprospiraceae bacterium]|nr:hypothetical protein [Candidatus Defluviibacterium haderslevense]
MTEDDQLLISSAFKAFLNWLDSLKLRGIVQLPEISFESISLDETLQVDKDGLLHFNLSYLKLCSVKYFVTILLHEAYHVYINGIPNKRDAVRVRDFYQNQMMLHIDIEADYYVARFFSVHYKCSYEDYLQIYYSGSSAFLDEEVRPLKFERFVGSMLTICHFFKYHEMAIYRLSPESVRIYQTNPIAILHKGTHSETKKIKLSIEDLNTLQKIYHKPNEFGEAEYVYSMKTILENAIDGNFNIEPRVTFSS